MRGADKKQDGMFSYVSLEARVPQDHPLRAVRTIVDAALKSMSRDFARLYAHEGRPSIAPECLLRALLLQVFYSIRSERLLVLEQRVQAYDRRIAALARDCEPARRLMQLEGIGPVTATALVATVGDARAFNNGRQFAAWLGLVPRHFATGGKARMGRISKRGDVYLRTLLVHGARSVLRTLNRRDDAKSQWVSQIKARRGYNKAAVALAAKHARILWAMLAHDSAYRPAVVMTQVPEAS